MWKNPYQMIFENYPTWAFSKERFLKKKRKRKERFRPPLGTGSVSGVRGGVSQSAAPQGESSDGNCAGGFAVASLLKK